MYKYHKGSTQSIQQHKRNMAKFAYTQQQIRFTNNKKHCGYKPKHCKHVKNKTTKLLQLNNIIENQQLTIFALARKVNKIQQPEVL